MHREKVKQERDLYTEKYAKFLSTIPELSEEEERELVLRWRNDGDIRARNAVVLANLRIAVAVARKHHRYGLQVKDMISMGTVGLMHALDKYDLDRRVRFGAYAWHWVRAMITRAECKEWHSVSGCPTGSRRLFSMLKAHSKALTLYGNNQHAIHKHIADQINIPVETASKWLNHICSREISLDTTFSYDDSQDQCMKDDLADQSKTPDQVAEDNEISRLVQERLQPFMDALSPRHVKIITRRFLDDDPVSLETIGREEGITRERVRQIENALRFKLRALLEDIADDLGIDVDSAMIYVLPVIRKKAA